ncbi:hypothetical protein ABL78_7735 [Leptomonas seymouri]|uniref:Uncharacterized protein n=1 Tax=Leptomonas seymouri TaxID=5684 RepID=A0A0N1HTK9_LEPSE|nr:hypothetical protein ABL78_7735 [Leptomonas seymouri]|eukprot:KPI83232.1 hypothetical protein ABL78_7735 [Leptomonas seymouri]
MHPRLGSQCARHCTAITAAFASSSPMLSRSYIAPAYPVNSTDLPSQRRSESHPSASASSSSTRRGRDGVSRSHPPRITASSEVHPVFTKLDLQNPPLMPSPTYYATYEEYLDAYDRYLKDTDHYTTSARAFVQTRFQKLRAGQVGMADVVRREYLWTFIPLLFCLSVFIIDRSNRSAAAFTHRVIKERTKQKVKHVKWERI